MQSKDGCRRGAVRTWEMRALTILMIARRVQLWPWRLKRFAGPHGTGGTAPGLPTTRLYSVEEGDHGHGIEASCLRLLARCTVDEL